jgi:ectoine hydroxylase-related dioxygenase (phytanoyl-CoA dioxygenase family)
MIYPDQSGAMHLPGLFEVEYDSWLELCAPYFEQGLPGVRITGDIALAQAIKTLAQLEPLVSAMGSGQWVCVRAIAFDKGPETNWTLGWHQDRTIAVKQRVRVARYDHWSSKQGFQHVEPPFQLIERMYTLRMHFDPVRDDNGPLLVALGSHGVGKIADSEVSSLADSRPQLSCHADRGDGWLCKTPIVHASGRSTSSSRRRVLQLDFSREQLPGGLEWLGID